MEHRNQASILDYLRAKSPLYYGKVIELRDAVGDWLSYIPQTFPHYTRHTVGHSDEILVQISRLLFRAGEWDKPCIALSPVETYILSAACYLHDAGMVVSDQKRIELLSTDEWKAWVAPDGGGRRRWEGIHDLRSSSTPPGPDLRNYLCDLQLRFLIADFVRHTHHLRSAEIMRQHEYGLGRFAFGDPLLLRTISNVCISHGLAWNELQDGDRFPLECDVRDGQANVRLLCILLRLGDLLDLSSERACPLLLNAASPLPADSLVHWTQYQRIYQRLTSPDKIVVKASCETQEEHRVLYDWCQWIVSEVRHAETISSKFTRHREWRPPEATMEGAAPSITVQPSPTARYVPSAWRFELDHDAVFRRLIYDVYGSHFSFIRELIQNGLDANRAQMYLDLARDNMPVPAYPTQVDEQRRLRYRMLVQLDSIEIVSSISGERETRHVITVDDSGIGMDVEVIERYLLQVGRSYYTTDEFRRGFAFMPSSRFGIGFLSVFAASDNVVINTYKPSAGHDASPIRMTLTGPRSYLLRERGDRSLPGTSIRVQLREQMPPGELLHLVSEWCRRVEFPIEINDHGVSTTLMAERPEQFVNVTPVVAGSGGEFIIKHFPVALPGVEGELYVFALVDEQGESWASWNWAKYTYPNQDPRAVQPEMPDSLTCVNGIAVGPTGVHRQWTRGGESNAARIDIRRDVGELTLARDAFRQHADVEMAVDLSPRWVEVLEDHLRNAPRATAQDGWWYRQRLIPYFRLPAFWATTPSTILVYVNGERRLLALCDIQPAPVITSVLLRSKITGQRRETSENIQQTRSVAFDNDLFTLLDEDVSLLSDDHRESIFHGRKPMNFRGLSSGDTAIDWQIEPESLLVK